MPFRDAAIYVSLWMLVAMSSAARADMSCQAIRYSCDTEKDELEITSEWKECDSGASPFKFFDTELAGLYDADRIHEPLVKKCPLGKTPLTVVMSAACSAGDGTKAPAIGVYRDPWLTVETAKGLVKASSEPFVYASRFGSSCGPDDGYLVRANQIVVKLLKKTPEQFSVELK